MMSRLFAFGCSFTQYKWPTWADIVAREFEVYENWGRGGAGNFYIYSALIECHTKKSLTDQDTIAVMWSSTGREDRYIDGEWITKGNVHLSDGFYDQNYLEKYIDPRGLIMRDLSLIYGAKHILDSIGCRYFFMSMVPLANHHDYFDDGDKNYAADVLPYFSDVMNIMRPSMFEVVFDSNWDSREFSMPNKQSFWRDWYDNIKDETWPSLSQKTDFFRLPTHIKQECQDIFGFFIPNKDTKHGRVDYHPTPLEHLEYIDNVLPEFSVSAKTRAWVADYDQKVRANSYEEIGCTQTTKRW